MKGASDGGIFIPHNEKRFPGYDPETKELDAEVLQKYITGGHVAEYMESLEEEDDERFKKQFATYLADDIGSADIEELYTEAYSKIRENPEFKPTEKDVAKWTKESSSQRSKKLTREQRRERVETKIAAYRAGKVDADEDEEDDE
jgi:large subunit ribosomal protein L5e